MWCREGCGVGRCVIVGRGVIVGVVWCREGCGVGRGVV